MLAEALQAGVDARIAAHAAEWDENGHQLVVRYGNTRSWQVLTSAGANEMGPQGRREITDDLDELLAFYDYRNAPRPPSTGLDNSSKHTHKRDSEWRRDRARKQFEGQSNHFHRQGSLEAICVNRAL